MHHCCWFVRRLWHWADPIEAAAVQSIGNGHCLHSFGKRGLAAMYTRNIITVLCTART